MVHKRYVMLIYLVIFKNGLFLDIKMWCPALKAALQMRLVTNKKKIHQTMGHVPCDAW
jgi:hypothetical protein